MKQLIVSLKTSSEVLNDFKKAYRQAKDRKSKLAHYEISFDNKKDFDRFIRNIDVLSQIITFKPKSVYELAKILNTDVSNLNKTMRFFEEIDAVKLVSTRVSGRIINTPVVEYDRIEFKLAA